MPWPDGDRDIPSSGEILPGGKRLKEVDRLLKDILVRHQVPGAAVAITYHGRLVLARGYGWADIENRQAVEPETRFVLASVSKAITTVAAMKLIDEGRLKLDDHAFEVLGEIKSPPGTTPDSRLKQITIRMLMHHAGGWDRNIGGDPFEFSTKVARELHVKLPITADQLIYFMNGRPLDFDPGAKEIYSNYGFIVLGQVIAHVMGEPYEESVQKLVFDPMGVQNMQMASPRAPGHIAPYLPNEARRYFIGRWNVLPGGHVEATGAAGGWCGSAVAMARFLTALDGSRTQKQFLSTRLMHQMLFKPEPPLKVRSNGSWFGLGWDAVREIPDWPHGKGLAYAKDGGVNGISTWIEHLPGDIDWVVLFNGTVPDEPDAKDAAKSKSKSAHTKSDAPSDKANDKPADKSTDKATDKSGGESPGNATSKPADKSADDKSPEASKKPFHPPAESALRDIRPRMVELLRSVKEWPDSGDLFSKFR